MENKSGKYFKYAIGEIVLVVIGILIALQINNWNQNRISKELESQYCNRLLEDVREEKVILQGLLNYSTQVVSHAKNAISVYENSPDSNPNPVDNLIDMYQASQIMDPNSAESTYRELIASGQINLIQNDRLKTALIRYYEVDWTESILFKLTNSYRKNLRGKMPDPIQTEIRSKCGDIFIKYKKGYGFEVVLPKTCEVDIDATFAQSVVDVLSKDESLKKDLRYLIGNESSKLQSINAVIVQLEDLISQLETINID
ncbi:DUF6090 family protein [Psychroserpens ponticola]|uniref:DUF6090 family protein n=1 Tax=Psychroserpens ponticola TaxID=2932268 RepID=A0ABY7RUE5_9FLAO|nr:DUF6090 family protein [Psychroserpens ponticola]WCO00448.1 DUF6090 family protein [Psychroserpens ponticola]